MCTYAYLKSAIINIKHLNFIINMDRNSLEVTVKVNEILGVKIEKGKVFQRIINVFCSTSMHCFM